MNQLTNNLLDFLFPKRCVGCKKIGTYFCQSCISKINQTDLVCPFCEKSSIGGVTHPICRRKYGLDGLWSLGIYEYPLRQAIGKLKYKWITELADNLTNILIEYFARNPPYLLDLIKKDQGKNWLIVPVPLYWQRQNWRGFNQASLLGKLLAKKMGLKYQEALTRIKSTKQQVGQAASKRRENIKGAFSLTHNSLPITHNILLIDDVWTTGSTLKECCFILKKASAKSVWALTLAR